MCCSAPTCDKCCTTWKKTPMPRNRSKTAPNESSEATDRRLRVHRLDYERIPAGGIGLEARRLRVTDAAFLPLILRGEESLLVFEHLLEIFNFERFGQMSFARVGQQIAL